MSETVPTPKSKKAPTAPQRGTATVVLRQRKGETHALAVVFAATAIEFGYSSNTLIVRDGKKIVATFNAGVWERATFDDARPLAYPHVTSGALTNTPVSDENPRSVGEAA